MNVCKKLLHNGNRHVLIPIKPRLFIIKFIARLTAHKHNIYPYYAYFLSGKKIVRDVLILSYN